MMTDAGGFPLRGAMKLATAAKDQVCAPLGTAALSRVASDMALALRERMGWQKALVALAHKNASILWTPRSPRE